MSMTQQLRQWVAPDSGTGAEVVWNLRDIQLISDNGGESRQRCSAGPNILVKGDL